jgi:hypothetical protein
MRNNDCRTGLYLAVHFKANNWLVSDWRKAASARFNVNELRQQLSDQAADLSGGMSIRSYVLDASLDSTTASVG